MILNNGFCVADFFSAFMIASSSANLEIGVMLSNKEMLSSLGLFCAIGLGNW